MMADNLCQQLTRERTKTCQLTEYFLKTMHILKCVFYFTCILENLKSLGRRTFLICKHVKRCYYFSTLLCESFKRNIGQWQCTANTLCSFMQGYLEVEDYFIICRNKKLSVIVWYAVFKIMTDFFLNIPIYVQWLLWMHLVSYNATLFMNSAG